MNAHPSPALLARPKLQAVSRTEDNVNDYELLTPLPVANPSNLVTLVTLLVDRVYALENQRSERLIALEKLQNRYELLQQRVAELEESATRPAQSSRAAESDRIRSAVLTFLISHIELKFACSTIAENIDIPSAKVRNALEGLKNQNLVSWQKTKGRDMMFFATNSE